MAVLRGQHTAAVSTSGGYIVLNTVPLINQALGKVSGLASDLTGKPVTLPAITSADPPQQAVNKLSKALGVTLPSNFGQITLVKSSDLADVQRGVKAFDRLTLVLPLVTIVLIALSLWLSVNRRRTVLQLAVGVSLLMIVERRIVLHEQSTLASDAHNPQVAQSVLGDLLHGYFVLTAWVLGVALVVLVIAVLSGPYRWAVALRSRVTRTWRGIAAASSGDGRGQVVGWMATHAAGLQLAGAVAAGILLLIVPVSWLSFLIIGVLLAAYEIYLQRIKPPPPDEAPPAPAPGNQAGLPVSHRRNLDKGHRIPQPVDGSGQVANTLAELIIGGCYCLPLLKVFNVCWSTPGVDFMRTRPARQLPRCTAVRTDARSLCCLRPAGWPAPRSP